MENPVRTVDVIMYMTVQRMKRHNYREYVNFIPISFLNKLREYDREKTGIRIIDRLAKSIIKKGITEPLIIEWYPPTGEVLLSEGNHRLAVAKILRLPALPVRVLVKRYEFSKNKYGRGPVVLVKPIEGYVKQNQRPSDIGLPTI